MIIVDAHCDTALSLLNIDGDIYENSLHLDLRKLLSWGKRVQFFAAFAEPSEHRNNELTKVLSIIDYMYLAEQMHRDKIAICLNAIEIESALEAGKVAGILSIEGGEALNGELSVLRQLYRIGVRSMMLTWNHRNLLADGTEEINGAGLSVFGRQVVEEMGKLGMIIDVSHLCEAGFYDVLDISTHPVIASHSNSRYVCDNLRNLSDHQLFAIKKNGGVVGLNFYPHFLNNTENASIDDVIEHLEHICSLIGEDHIGIGSDYDGIEVVPNGLEGPHKLPNLFNKLAQLNYSQQFIEKFAGLNFMRVIKQILK